MQTHSNESTGIQRPLLPVQGNMGELGSQYIPHSHPGSTQKSNSVCKWPEVPEELQTTATQVAKCWEPCQQRSLCSNISRQQRTYWAWHETFTEQPKCLQIEAAFWARMAGGKKKTKPVKITGKVFWTCCILLCNHLNRCISCLQWQESKEICRCFLHLICWKA